MAVGHHGANAMKRWGKQTGAILVTTILLVVILTILVLSLMQAVWLYFKASNRIAVNHQEFYQLEAMASKPDLIKHLLNDKRCTTHGKDPNQLIDLLLAEPGCQYEVDGQNYSYLLGDLGVYPCLKIISANKNYASHHWLVTIMTADRTLLQLRIAIPASPGACEQQVQYIDEGVISWRYLPSR